MDSDEYDLRAYPLFQGVLGGKSQPAAARRCLAIDPSGDASDAARRQADTLGRNVAPPVVLDTGMASEGNVTVYKRSPDFSFDRRLEMMRDAETRIDIMGIANLALAIHPDTETVTRARSGGALEIRVLQCAPSNAGLAALLGARKTHELGEIQAEIERARDAWQRIADVPGLDVQLTIRRAQASLPMANALITDRAVVATPYLRSRPTAASPTLHARAGDAYHTAISEEFNLLWGEAATVFRADRAMLNGHARHPDADDPAASYWAPPAASVAIASAPATAEPARVNDTSVRDGADQVDAPPPHGAGGTDMQGLVHYQLFGSPGRNGAPEGEPLAAGIALKPAPPTTNKRGHAIIRSVG